MSGKLFMYIYYTLNRKDVCNADMNELAHIV